MKKEDILEELKLFQLRTGGFGSWITPDTDPEVFDRLSRVGNDPITKVQFNQLLAFGHEAPVSEDFFRYYWLSAPDRHPYSVAAIPHEWGRQKRNRFARTSEMGLEPVLC